MIDDCKKMKTCVYCGALNGTVKKKPNDVLKIMHARFNTTKDHELQQILSEFEHTATQTNDFEKHLKNFAEDLDPLKVSRLFENILDEDVPLFQMSAEFCRPQDLLLTSIAAPPVCIRPSVAVTATIKNEDDLTVKLAEIVATNKEIEQVLCRGLGENKLIENWNMLQYHTAQYFNADTPGLPLQLMQ